MRDRLRRDLRAFTTVVGGCSGTVAAGVLLELGLCQTLPEAEAMAKSIRPVINIKPDQRLSLARLYPVGSTTSPAGSLLSMHQGV